MKRKPLSLAVKLGVTGAMAGLLAACGGGSDNADVSTTSAGTSVGPVSGFGSVYVNGTRFRTDNASVTSNDDIERETQLEKGMILKISGNWGDDGEGEAKEIEYDDTLRGPVSNLSWDDIEKTGTLTLAGQTVSLDGQTVFKGATPVELSADPSAYLVRVSAWRLDDGSFRASFVGARMAGSSFGDQNEVEIEGVVAALDTQMQTFTINGLLVDYTNAVFDDDFEESELADNVIVEVEGFLDNGTLVARELDNEDSLFDGGDDVEIAGAIGGAYDEASRQFGLNGFTVQVNDGTKFDDGLREADLADGVLVKVEGEFRNGVIVAGEIEPREGEAELDGVIEARGADGESLTVAGVQVWLTGNTLIEDDREDNDEDHVVRRVQDIESLSVGDYVEIEGRETSENGGGLVAFNIETEDDSDNQFELEGRVAEVTGSGFTVMGLELTGAVSGINVGDRVEVDYEKTTGGEYRILNIELKSSDSGSDDD